MAVGDLYQLKAVQLNTPDTQEHMNVYHYLQTAGAASDADDLALNWAIDVMPGLLAIQSNRITYVRIEVENLNSPTDFYTAALSTSNVGTRTGEMLPQFVNWAFRLNRATTLVRHGQKRIMGVAEGDQSNGIEAAGIVAALNNAAAALGGVVADAIGGVWTPRIARIAPPAAPSSFPIQNAQYVRISTQNTRKR